MSHPVWVAPIPLQAAISATTIGGMPGPVTDVRAGVLRGRYHQRFSGAEIPVPVTAIVEDLCGLSVEEDPALDVSGMLIPPKRRIYLNASESAERRRFTLAHELGHWVCQCLEGVPAPRYCRADEIGLEPTAKVLEREANVFAAELLMPEQAVRTLWAGSVESCAQTFGVSVEAMHSLPAAGYSSALAPHQLPPARRRTVLPVGRRRASPVHHAGGKRVGCCPVDAAGQIMKRHS